MKVAIVMGLIFIVAGAGSLAYFFSPVRMLMLAYVPHNNNLKIPLTGGLLLACGIGLLFVSKAKTP
jgi:hypothetical protein